MGPGSKMGDRRSKDIPDPLHKAVGDQMSVHGDGSCILT